MKFSACLLFVNKKQMDGKRWTWWLKCHFVKEYVMKHGDSCKTSCITKILYFNHLPGNSVQYSDTRLIEILNIVQLHTYNILWIYTLYVMRFNIVPYTPACFSTFYQSNTDVPITLKIPKFLVYLFVYIFWK